MCPTRFRQISASFLPFVIPLKGVWQWQKQVGPDALSRSANFPLRTAASDPNLPDR